MFGFAAATRIPPNTCACAARNSTCLICIDGVSVQALCCCMEHPGMHGDAWELTLHGRQMMLDAVLVTVTAGNLRQQHS